MLNKIRLWIIKKLLKESDGYVNLGLSEGESINFYYDENINKHVLGIRRGNFYYAQLNICGLCCYMSRYLDWSDTHKEPKVVPFNRWMHGVLEQIHEEYEVMKCHSK